MSVCGRWTGDFLLSANAREYGIACVGLPQNAGGLATVRVQTVLLSFPNLNCDRNSADKRRECTIIDIA